RDDLLSIDVIWPRHRNPLLVLGGHFEIIEDNIKTPALECRDELVPLILNHLCLRAELGSDSFGKIHFEPDELLGFVGIRINVRRTAFRVSPPAQHPELLNFREMISGEGGGRPACEQENEN